MGERDKERTNEDRASVYTIKQSHVKKSLDLLKLEIVKVVFTAKLGWLCGCSDCNNVWCCFWLFFCFQYGEEGSHFSMNWCFIFSL